MGQQSSTADKKLMKQHSISKQELQALKKVFKEHCRGNRKTLSKTEFRDVYRDLFPGDPTKFADEMFRSFDIDHNGEVDFVEFVRSISMCDSKNVDEKIEIAFKLYDHDGSGTIGQNEVKELLEAYSDLIGVPLEGGKSGEQLAKEFFQEMDTDADQTVTFDEFKQAARKNEAILAVVNPHPPEWDEKT